MKPISARRLWVVRGLAVAADGIQVGLAPFFAEGFFSVFADGLDVVMCILMTWLVGWHLAFLPTIAVKLVPIVDLAPCWTIAVLIATRRTPRLPEKPGNDDRQAGLLKRPK